MTTNTPRFLTDFFYINARRSPDAAALHYFDAGAGDWRSLTWRDYEERVRKVAGWLLAQGIQRGDRVVILSANRPEWLIADLAILSIGAVSVPIYATSAVKDVAFILGHSEAKAIFTDTRKRIKELTTSLPAAVAVFEDFAGVLSGPHAPLTAPVAVDPEDLATIVYTSGTTGEPKGVVHTQAAVAATLPSITQVTNHGKTGPDRLFSFLPLAHVAERVLVEFVSVFTGTEIAFARSVDTLIEDLAHFRPTILLCVPRLWEKVYERIMGGVKTAKPAKKAIFNLALRLGQTRCVDGHILKARDHTWQAKLADLLVGKALRKRLGMDRVRIFATGSAPTRPEVLRFFAAFGIFIREVYGLTENLCLGVYTSPDEIIIGSCGQPFAGNTVKIGADGEILFKAPFVFKGYYKNPAATAEALTPDGWLATGDLGTLDAQGNLRITGRKKELLKTSTGKYVAPVPIENALKTISNLVSDAMVVGDSQKYCVALLSLAEPPKDKAGFDTELKAHLDSLNASLPRHETIVRVGILKEGFSVENGLLTPTMKVKRQAAQQRYSAFIDQLYKSSTPIIYE